MGNRTLNNDSAISASALAYASLSTDARPVTPDLVARIPRIREQLDELDEVLQHELTVAVEKLEKVAGAEGTPAATRFVWEHSDVRPYGRAERLADCWHRLLAASDSPDALRLADLYYSQSLMYRDAVPIEAYCYAADINPLRVIEWLTAVLVRQGITASTLLASVWHPRLVEKSIERGLTDSGFRDRQLMHKAVGFLPAAKGSQTIIQVNAGQPASVKTVSAPAPEATIGLLGGAFNEARGLPPAPVTAAVVDAEVVEDADDADETD